jgi:hypothetical protein
MLHHISGNFLTAPGIWKRELSETPYNRRISEKMELEIRKGVIKQTRGNEIPTPPAQQDCFKSLTKSH